MYFNYVMVKKNFNCSFLVLYSQKYILFVYIYDIKCAGMMGLLQMYLNSYVFIYF